MTHGDFMLMGVKSQLSEICGLSVCESQRTANKASETVKVTTQGRDPTDWQMSDKLNIQCFLVDVCHDA